MRHYIICIGNVAERQTAGLVEILRTRGTQATIVKLTSVVTLNKQYEPELITAQGIRTDMSRMDSLINPYLELPKRQLVKELMGGGWLEWVHAVSPRDVYAVCIGATFMEQLEPILELHQKTHWGVRKPKIYTPRIAVANRH